jgi:hypothetical protein
MSFSSDEDVARVARSLIDRTLPKAEWTHAAHFAAALWIVREHGRDAERVIPGLIRAYNEATGGENTDTAGYHETITLASLRAVRARLAAETDAPLWRVLDGLLASELGRSGWLLAYWSKERLFSVEARRAWVEPDLRALPFGG